MPRIGEKGRYCTRCHRYKGMIHSYGLQLCRRCFREVAENIGFKKYG
ncbi:30S ribosomal protein S14 [Candidatus Micrarchaeota archaeon]|nr:30S ribosomal protein S14 [Candidatus Micrarchaeota archaeon]